MTDDADLDAKTEEWATQVEQSDLVPKIAESAIVAQLYGGKVDAKLAVELGFAILFDKPLLIVTTNDAEVPKHLARAADKVIVMGPDTAEEVAQFIQDQVQ